MPCNCRRCETLTECLSVVFVVQHGFDDETTYDLCASCYEMYSGLYTTRLEDYYEAYEADDDPEEDPAPPDTNTTGAEIDDPL